MYVFQPQITSVIRPVIYSISKYTNSSLKDFRLSGSLKDQYCVKTSEMTNTNLFYFLNILNRLVHNA